MREREGHRRERNRGVRGRVEQETLRSERDREVGETDKQNIDV